MPEIQVGGGIVPKNRYRITCQEPGCLNQILYTDDTVKVSLYCKTHRTEYGKHSATRVLKNIAPLDIKQDPMVILKCTIRACSYRMNIKRADWFREGEEISFKCPKCGNKMLYHKDVKDE